MNKFKLVLATILAAVLMNSFSAPVFAEVNQEVDQEQEQEFEVVCETGGYGQTTTCRVVGSQEQAQYVSQTADVVYVEVRDQIIAVPRHEVVDTALDFKSYLAAVGTLVLGGIASILKIKSRVA